MNNLGSYIISLDGGRELRSLAYAPFGAARGRAPRTCGPAHPMANTSSAVARGTLCAAPATCQARATSGPRD